MFAFQSERISDSVWRIHGFSDEQMYLVEGSERAALIDTGVGVGDLKGYVEQLTQKEIIVILTHGHCDHGMGAGQFDVVYMNPGDEDVYRIHGEKAYRDAYLATVPAYGDLETEVYMEPMPMEQMQPLSDDMCISLGDITLRMLACPGHTPGMMTVLIEEERLLIAGDACNPFTFLFLEGSLSLDIYEENLKRLMERTKGKYDRVLFSHGNVETPAIEVFENVLTLCDEILSGKAEGEPFVFMDGKKGVIARPMDFSKMERVDGKLGNLVYDPENIWRCDGMRRMFRESDRKRDAGLKTPEEIRRFDDISYGEDADLQKLDIYRPKAAGDRLLPVIISVHGGGWVYGDKDTYQYYCMELARKGFGVVNFSYRLAPQHRYPAALEDVASVFAWMKRHWKEYGLDLSRVFVVADSAGAQLASQYITALTNRGYRNLVNLDCPEDICVRAVALNCGVYDMKAYLEQDESGMREVYLGKAVEQLPAGLDVPEYMTSDFPPTFFMTAYYDFLKAHTEKLYQCFLEKGIPCELHCFGDAMQKEIAHVFHLNIRLKEAVLCNQLECDFFRRYGG